jgi:diacylglycerol kinase (ATP)
LQSGLGCQVMRMPTSGPGHAEELARSAAAAGWPVVAAAGGDGTVHEVANGILQAGNSASALAVIPIGSANDYAYALGLGSKWWRQHDRPLERRPVDVGRIECSSGKKRFFVNGAGIGFNGAVTFESRSIRGLQGVALYSIALLRALWRHYRFPMIEVEIDGLVRRCPTLALSSSLGKREGNFLLAPQAKLDDGFFDYLQAGPIRWWEVLRYLPGMIFGKLPTDHPSLWLGRCRRMAIRAESPVFVHLDGELFSLPADQELNFQIDLLPCRLEIWGRFPAWAERESPSTVSV